MIETAHPTGEACRNCGHILDGPFCAECGQAEHDGHAPTIAHFFHDLVHESVHVDGTIFRTLKALFFQPGKLTEEYWSGHIVSWVRPIRLFLVIAALHLLISTSVGPMNFSVGVERSPSGEPSYNLIIGADRHFLDKGNPFPEEQRRELIEAFKHAYDSVRYTAFLLFGFASWLLYLKQQPYFVGHVIAGLHFYSFWYLLGIVVSLLAKLHPNLNLLGFLSFVYLFLVLRYLFHEHWLLRLVKTLAFTIVIVVTELALFIAAASWVIHRSKFL